MMMANGFRSPEEAALGLDLPLIVTLTAAGEIASPVAAVLPEDERTRSKYRRVAERILASADRAHGPVGVVGDLAGPQLAHVTNLFAAAGALMRPVVLVDADLAGAHLAFDTMTRAQEGLVDVLRYGVKAARLIAPTSTPGLSLLPVGAGTVDSEGTFASPAVEGLFADLERAGELVLVNGPAAADLEGAGPFVARIGGWILIHEVGRSSPEGSAEIRDRLGREKIIGVVALAAEMAAEPPVVEGPAEVPIPAEPPVVEKPAEVPITAEPPVVEKPAEVPITAEPPVVEEPAEVPVTAEPPLVEEPAEAPAAFKPPVVEEPAAAPAAERPEPEPAALTEAAAAAAERAPQKAEARPLVRRGLLVVGIVVLGIAAVWFVRGFLTSEPLQPAGPADRELAGETGTPGRPQDIVPTDSIQVRHSPARELAAVGAGTADTLATAPSEGEGEAAPAIEQSRPRLPGEIKTPRPEPPATPVLSEVYGVHVSSLTAENDAWQDAERFYARGYSVAVRGEDIAGKGHWYRVYVGPFVDREEASRIAAEIREAGLEDYTMVRRLPASMFEQPQGGVRGER